jgi:two-component system, OmpR family, alkaline phosphatase synthesis response regulator PhoP
VHILAKVLIVEDESSLLELLAMVVEEMGHQVFTASNGQKGLALIEKEQPNLVISDVMMPVMNGYELLGYIRLRPEWQQIKVVLISAVPINKTREPKADGYMAKPYNINEVEALIERLTAA